MKSIGQAILLGVGVSVLAAVSAVGQTLPVTLLHKLTNCPDGFRPLGLVSDGTRFFGITQSGGVTDWGSSGNGTIFAINGDGTGYTLLHTFTARPSSKFTNSDGALPGAGLLLVGDTLYGTTEGGGANGEGVLFSVGTNGTYTVLYNFLGGTNGSIPLGTLTLSNGTFYGTMQYGGNQPNKYGSSYGTIFSVNINGSGFTVLHDFTVVDPGANADGGEPYGGLVLSGNTLYGTAIMGGSGSGGTVFSVNTDGTIFTVLHNFSARTTNNIGVLTNFDGGAPQTTLTLAGNTLYGVAQFGGAYGSGTIFAVNTNGTGFKLLHAFNGSDGKYPSTPLALSGNMLYGGTSSGSGMFAINTDGTGFAAFRAPTNCFGSLVVQSGGLFFTASNSIFGTPFPSVPAAIIQPSTLTATVGTPAVLNSVIYGSQPLNYQWLFNGTNIPNATNPALAFTNAFPANAGLYTIIVSNSYGAVTSASARLSVSALALIGPQLDANGQFQFGLNTVSGVNYSVQYSTTLMNWFPLTTFSGNDGLISITDTNMVDGACFYRVLPSPQ